MPEPGCRSASDVRFVSVSQDPTHDPGPSNRHTGELLVWADWSSVAEYAAGGAEEHAGEWAAFKQDVEAKMMGFFVEKFPAVAPLVVYRELGTPLATAAFTRHEKGGSMASKRPRAVCCRTRSTPVRLFTVYS